MINIFFLSLKDFFSIKFLKFAFLPLIISLLIFIALGVFLFSYFLDYFNLLFISDPSSWFAWFYNLGIIKFLFSILSFLFTSFIVVFASVFLAFFIVSFLTPQIVNLINKKYYKKEILNQIPAKSIIWQIFKITLKFIIMLIISLFFMFIPFVNFILFYLVFYYLFHKLLILDVASSTLNNEEFKDFYKKSSPLTFKLSTFCFYTLSSIPFLGLFLQVFYVIFLSHLFYQKVSKLKIS